MVQVCITKYGIYIALVILGQYFKFVFSLISIKNSGISQLLSDLKYIINLL